MKSLQIGIRSFWIFILWKVLMTFNIINLCDNVCIKDKESAPNKN